MLLCVVKYVKNYRDSKGWIMMRSKTCLNGFWDFAPATRDDHALPTAWDAVKIQVPSPFNVNSFSHPYPKNTAGEEYLVQGGDFRLYPEYPVEWDSLSAGYYRRTLDIPALHGGERLFLHFDAVAFRSEYYLNGQKIGEFADGFMPYEVEITAFVHPGENELIVRAETVAELIYRDEEGKRRADYPHGSFWGGHIGGIWQDAWLIARPAAYVSDIFAVSDVYKKTLTVRYETVDAEGLTVRFALKRFGDDTAAEREILAAPCDGTELCWSWQDGDVALWELDAPALYTLTARLYDGERPVDETSVRIGFRTFTAEGDHFLLNGRPLRLKNDSWHYMGYSIQTPEYARAYYRMAKDAHVNIIRLHAQPFPSFFFDVADEEGMLLVSESCVWASHCIFSYNEEFFRHSREHVARWVRRDRNHPSVVMWSPENECIPAYKVCGSPAIRDVADLEAKLYDLTQVIPPLDDSRLISCDGSGDLGGRMPVNSLHYPGYGCPVPPERRDRPITIGEMGSMYFSTPDNVCMVDGQSALYSRNGRLTAVGRDAFHNLTGQRKWAGQVCVFNLIWYGLEPLPFTDRALTYDDYTAPGIKPSRITPYLRTLNAGGEDGLPEYIPNPVWELTRAAYTPIRFFFENEPSAVFAGEEATFPVTLFNDDATERALTITATLATADGQTTLGSRAYTVAACTYTEDTWQIAVPSAGDATLTLTLTDSASGEELFAESRTLLVLDRAALTAEWNASGVALLHGDDADVTDRPVIDCRRAAPYGSFMKSRAVQHLFAADGEEMHFAHEIGAYYFEEYLNFTATPLWFNGAGMPVALDLTPAGEARVLCGVDVSDEQDPLLLLLRVKLARRLAAAQPATPATACLYGAADSPVAAMLDEIRCDYTLLDDDALKACLRQKQNGLLIVDGSRNTRLLEAVSANSFERVLVLGLTRTPDIFRNLFDVTDRRGFQLCPVTPDAATAGVYGNNLYGLGVGKEEALADRLLHYRAGATENILLGLPNVDWRMWNNNAENLKTVSLLRSEQADNSRFAALSHHRRAGSDFYFSQLALNTQSKKAKNLLVRLLSALGASVQLAQNDDLNELLFAGAYGVQVNRMLAHPPVADAVTLHPGLNRVEEGAAWRAVQNDRSLPACALAVFVYSPQDRTDLLLNPDTVDLNVSAERPLTLWLNGKQQGIGERFTVTSITLAAGWNTLLMAYEGGAMPELKFHRTNLKKLDLKFGLYDADLKPQNMQRATLSSADRPDGVERAIAGREQHWRASGDQRPGMDFEVAFPAPITARALYFSGSPSDFDRDVFTPYCFRLLAGDSPETMQEVFRAKFEDQMSYVNGRVFLRLDDVTARCFRLELTHNALKPWIISNLTFLS